MDLHRNATNPDATIYCYGRLHIVSIHWGDTLVYLVL